MCALAETICSAIQKLRGLIDQLVTILRFSSVLRTRSLFFIAPHQMKASVLRLPNSTKKGASLKYMFLREVGRNGLTPSIQQKRSESGKGMEVRCRSRKMYDRSVNLPYYLNEQISRCYN